MEAELKRLVPRALPGFRLAKPLRADEQTLIYPFSADLAWASVHYLRTSSRVLWDIYQLQALRLDPLYASVRALVESDARPWLEDGATISVDARNVADFPASPLQLRGTIKNAVIEGAAARGVRLTLDQDEPRLPLVLRGLGGDLTLSIDLAGRSMHARGYRLHVSDAPLKETLAAQMLMLSRWDARTEALVDPMCGAGTIVIEAAAMADGAPTWTADRSPTIDDIEPFRSTPHKALEVLFPGPKAPIVGNDIDEGCIRAAEGNLARAALNPKVTFHRGDFADLDLGAIADEASSRGGLILTNPPYGERLEPDASGKLEALYRSFARWCENQRGNWRVGMLNAHPSFDEIVGWKPRMRKPMSNGPLRAYFSIYDR